MLNNIKDKILKPNRKTTILVILLVGLVLRLISLNQSLWLDEAINVIAARDRSLVDLLTNYMIGDFHPPLFHFILWILFKFLPVWEVTTRLPSVIFGVLTILFTFLIGEKITKNKHIEIKIPSLAALLLSTSALHIYYSQEARMYSLAAFTSTLAIYLLLSLKENPVTINKLLYLFSLVLMLLSDYQTWLLFPLLLLLSPIISSLGVLLTLPWWPIMARQIEQGLKTAQAFPAWEAVVGKLTIKSLLLVPVKFLVGRTSIENNLLYASVLLIPVMTVGILLYYAFREKLRITRIVQGWLLLPLAMGVLVAFKIPIFSYFRFLFILPAFFLLIAKGLSRIPVFKQRYLAIILIATNLISSGAYLFLPRFHRENWKAAISHINEYQKDETLIIFPNIAQAAGFDYYNKNTYQVQDNETLDLSQNPDNVFFVKYVSEIFDPGEDIIRNLKKNQYNKKEELSFNSIVIWQYEKLENE